MDADMLTHRHRSLTRSGASEGSSMPIRMSSPQKKDRVFFTKDRALLISRCTPPVELRWCLWIFQVRYSALVAINGWSTKVLMFEFSVCGSRSWCIVLLTSFDSVGRELAGVVRCRRKPSFDSLWQVAQLWWAQPRQSSSWDDLGPSPQMSQYQLDLSTSSSFERASSPNTLCDTGAEKLSSASSHSTVSHSSGIPSPQTGQVSVRLISVALHFEHYHVSSVEDIWSTW